MARIRQNLWISAMAFGLVFLALGLFFVMKGLDAKAEIRAALRDENVTTSADAENFGVPGGLLIQDAKAAQAQADTIKMHSIDRYGRYTDMARDDPNRATYISGLTLRNALNLAVLGFGVADLAIGTGAVIILFGIATLGVAVPALYWAREAEDVVAARVASGQLVRQPAR